MKLINMKREGSDYGMECPGVSNYGYGLCINLNDEQCEAMGIDKALRAGTKVSVNAIGVVTSSSERLDRDGEKAYTGISMQVQLTDLGMQSQGMMRNAAQVLYGDD